MADLDDHRMQKVTLSLTHDTQVDAANLAIRPTRTGRGPNYELLRENGTVWGLLRTSQDGRFDYLEILGASQSVPALLSDLNEIAGTPGVVTGAADAWLTASSDGSGTLSFSSKDREASVSATATDQDGNQVACISTDPEGELVRCWMAAWLTPAAE